MNEWSDLPGGALRAARSNAKQSPPMCWRWKPTCGLLWWKSWGAHND